MVRNLRSGLDWIPGVIVERLGPVSYLVETEGKEIKDFPTQQSLRSTEFEQSSDWDLTGNHVRKSDSSASLSVELPQPGSGLPEEPPAPTEEVCLLFHVHWTNQLLKCSIKSLKGVLGEPDVGNSSSPQRPTHSEVIVI